MAGLRLTIDQSTTSAQLEEKRILVKSVFGNRHAGDVTKANEPIRAGETDTCLEQQQWYI